MTNEFMAIKAFFNKQRELNNENLLSERDKKIIDTLILSGQKMDWDMSAILAVRAEKKRDLDVWRERLEKIKSEQKEAKEVVLVGKYCELKNHEKLLEKLQGVSGDKSK
jgi:CTP synthase (UTP-ammonia lyase)